MRVARCESDLVPTAVNGPGGSYGLFQFKPRTWLGTPFAEYDISTPALTPMRPPGCGRRAGAGSGYVNDGVGKSVSREVGSRRRGLGRPVFANADYHAVWHPSARATDCA